MRVLARRSVLAAALLAGLLVAGCNKAGASGGESSAKATGPAPMLTDSGIAFGNPHAKVTMVEYASASCSHCAAFDAEVFPTIKAKYIDTGKVRYEFREFITPPEQLAAASFLLARCAGPSKYFPVVEATFRAQPEIFANGDMRTPLVRIAQSVGLNEAQFTKCVSDTAALKALSERVQRAIDQAHISGTPTIIINGKQLSVGEPTLAKVEAALDPLVK